MNQVQLEFKKPTTYLNQFTEEWFVTFQTEA